jgi:squalene synthase HpnC
MSESITASGETHAPDLLTGAPLDYLTPEDRPTLDEALAWCHQLAATHYENFHVATFFLPQRLRPHFDSLYAYCRVADDLGDEVDDTTTALRLLDAWGQMLDQCYDAPQQSRHPVFVALRETIVACDLPRGLFHDLLHAFRQDQVKTRYGTWNEAVEYSRYSANPVGRLVLMVCGYRDEVRAQLSDKICTALQLANFWQDAVRDSEIGRRYIPTEYMAHFGVVEGQIEGRVFTPEFRSMMSDLVDYTREILHEGSALCVTVDDELRTTLELFCKGGGAILDGIEAQDFDVLRGRPVVTRRKKLMLLAGALLGKLQARYTARTASGVSEADSAGMDAWTAAAYRYCREVARREAKNFYWAFRVLPRHKSDAMCAVYAFMRRADDIADDESKPVEARRAEMRSWLEAWRAARNSVSANPANRAASGHLIFLALGDAQRRFNIPDSLLEELVVGTTMDLEPRARDLEAVQTYATFEELYRYCYLVASVVGLVCIRIFGYSDARAEKLAEETGVAFQLTNILRDVKEDVLRGRVYLPMDLMDEFGVTAESLRELAAGRAITERERAMLQSLATRAEEYYVSSNHLMPLLDLDSRAAMWVLVTIYHRLLGRIIKRKMDVFSQRVALPTYEKLAVLACGGAMAARNFVTRNFATRNSATRNRVDK